ncbi:pyruvate formate lyase activating enzyme [Desulfocicer vacuolatum DSM 3385]|uniref:Pyruvate formate lyase activating enzyme n=1 Tax=Desulfocicer vacuolatum DSM 3385 TaxID=1121400 RepID=A0A1W2CHT0_9BACT|nr:AmmeMemoRadiSam system radical SAM enzyme [Desulfocicer vacuolatum]SMC84524.1 pyruvate formate lyase activating enzyme [Desulfocicer vacuolatum DSM 3385]
MKTLLYEKLSRNRVKCETCHHYCVIAPGERGRCGVRENKNGTLYTLVYPFIVARGIDPVEKKPFFHIKPGSSSFSIASAGCNFTCTFCQNAHISKFPSPARNMETTPKELVNQALYNGCQSIACTYTEPTVYFELALETAMLAKEKGLLNLFVTNAYMSPQVIHKMAPYVDGANVDLKAFNDNFYRTVCGGRLEPVKQNIILMKSLGILVEVTTLIIPGYNDDRDEIISMAAFIAEKLGNETPWHISRFFPCHGMDHVPVTPDATLEMALQAGKDAGLQYVYIGNAPSLGREDTCCHNCGEIVIKRLAYKTENRMTTAGKCPLCNTGVHGIF